MIAFIMPFHRIILFSNIGGVAILESDHFYKKKDKASDRKTLDAQF